MNTVRTILAAPGIGMVFGTYGATQALLTDRQTNEGCAFSGEHLVRVPRRFVRTYHQRWCMERSMLKEAREAKA